MTHKTFVIADTHFGHRGVCIFTDAEGKKVRPWNTTEEMDEALVTNWNAVVRTTDKVYLLGDAVINRKSIPTLGRLNGNIILVAGNHDTFRMEEYAPYVKDIKGCVVLKDYMLTHIPVHPNQKNRFKGNIHGHLHHGKVSKAEPGELVGCPGFYQVIDDWYHCVSVEQINYTPLNIDEIIK